jgi:hypothetical protein
MKKRRRNKILPLAPLFGLLILVYGCTAGELLSDVSFSAETLTPNGDRAGDTLLIEYHLARDAQVSIYFVDQEGIRYDYRRAENRTRSRWDPYAVYFSGIVQGYNLPGEELDFQIVRRVLQDGDYTWVVEASDGAGHTQRVTGSLTVSEADTGLPGLENLTIYPPLFTPNRDGISDRARINVWLTKQVESLIVYLLEEDGTRGDHIPEDERSPALPGEPGLHSFDYDAGVDLGADPPPDGTYTVQAEAQDAIGQRTIATVPVTIQNGGVPRGYIYNGEVAWSSETILLGETLYFTLTVENDSATSLRTGGPPPGTVYVSDQNYATLGETIQSGVFRVGVGCEDSPIDYPWRWAVGERELLAEDEEGHLYLPPFTLATVTGGIRFVEITQDHNPQYCWTGLIHEDVEIALVNNRVDPVYLRIEE